MSIKYLVRKPAFFLKCLTGVKHATNSLGLSHQYVSFEDPKKVAVILVHKRAAKLPALKHFLHSKTAFCVVDFPILM